MKLAILNWWIKRFISWRKNLAAALQKLQILRYELLFGERDTDVYVVTYMKSGTTWLQMILYQLTTDGSMHFKHLNDVSPWCQNEAIKGLTPKDLPNPRIIKTHQPYHEFYPKTKGRFIVLERDPKDVAVSFFHHRKDYVQAPESFEAHLNQFFFDSKSDLNWFNYVKAWRRNKHQFQILYLQYEALHADFEGNVQRIANFLGVECSAETMERVKARSSFAFMKQHENKFGEQPSEQERVYNNFIRKGQTGGWKDYFTAETLAQMNDLVRVHFAGSGK